jgi:hypothetical protein
MKRTRDVAMAIVVFWWIGVVFTVGLFALVIEIVKVLR